MICKKQFLTCTDMLARFGEERKIPGSHTELWRNLADTVHFRTTVDSHIVVNHYEGPFVYDADGNEYFDGASGVGVASFGGGESLRHIWKEVFEYVKQHGGCGDIGTDWYNVPMVAAAQYILNKVSLFHSPNKIYFTGSGTQAIEAALKLIWDYHTKKNAERTSIVVWEGAFHGRTGYSLKLTDPQKRVRVERYPMANFEVLRAPFPAFGDPHAQKRIEEFFSTLPRETKEKVAGVFFETIQGEGGIRVSDLQALQWWVKMWRNEGATIVCDDIQCGLGRTGTFMSFENFNVLPDIVTIGKHLGSGIPVSAMIGPAFMDWEEHGRHSESFQGSPIAVVAAHETVRHLFGNEILAQNQKLGAALKRCMENSFTNAPGVIAVRGMGLMWGIEFVSEALRNVVLKDAERFGMRLIGAGFSHNPTIRFMPPFVATEEQVAKAVSILRKSLDRMYQKTCPKP